MQQSSEQMATIRRKVSSWPWLGPAIGVAAIGLYLVVRYAGQWAEADSTTFTNVIRAFVRDGRLVPESGYLYPNGYAFQALSASILALTGLDVPALQQLVYPLTAALVVLPAWIAYRELTDDTRGATLATILLFTQPEFLFVILRSSHEKFTRTLMLLCLYLLVRSFKLHDRPRLLATYVGLFYLIAFAFIVSNNLLAHSFIFAVALALFIGWLLEQRATAHQQNRHILKRFFYVTLICLGLVYVCTFYAYPPAQHDLLVLQTIGDRISALFLDVQTTGGQGTTNAYSVVQTGWVSLYVYFLVSIANWIILAISFAIWAQQGVRWLWRGEAPKTQVAWLLWLFYGAFAAQGALSAVVDASGALSSNLQHRLFPSFSIFAVALVATALVQWRPPRFTGPVRLGLTVGIFCIAMLSVFKATNEPILSNKWTFYRTTELAAMDWSDRNLKNSEIWSEFDERLSVSFPLMRSESLNDNDFHGGIGDPGAGVRSFVVSDVTRLRSVRLGVPLPVEPDAQRVYDNGEAEVYHLRPRTQFQR